jgi:ketosteroid isomerase-like protein
MSQQNIDLVRRMVEGFLAFQAGDPARLADAVAVLDPDIRWHGTVGGLDEGKVSHGYEEVARAFQESFETWEQLVLRTERYIDAGDKGVVVFWHEVARSRHSEQELETNTAVIYTVRNGAVVEARGYMDRAAALEAVGLSEQA